MKTEDLLRETVREVAMEIEAAVDGDLYELENGEFEIISDMEDWKKVQYAVKRHDFLASHSEKELDKELYCDVEEWLEDEIGTADDVEEPEQVGVSEAIEKRALSVEHWKINSSGECVGGEILVCYGGPSVWITEDGVFGAWGTDRTEWRSREVGDAVLEYLKESMPI